MEDARALLAAMIVSQETKEEPMEQINQQKIEDWKEQLNLLRQELHELNLTIKHKEEQKKIAEEPLKETKEWEPKLRKRSKKNYISKRIQSQMQLLFESSATPLEDSKFQNSSDSDEQQRREEMEQENIEKELLSIVDDLKRRGEMVRDSITDDNQMLKHKSMVVEKNVQLAQKQDNQLSQHYAAATWNLLSRIGLLGFVMITFFFMILLIRLFPKRW